MSTIDRLATLNLIRKLSRLMDASFRIPGTGFRFGLDPVLGIIPGAGDAVSMCISAYIIYMAASFRLPSGVLNKMIWNILLESTVGSIPIVGDLFDAGFKANLRNLDLLERHLGQSDPNLVEADSPQLVDVLASKL